MTTAKELSHSESRTESLTMPQYTAISEHSLVRGTPKAIREWLMLSAPGFLVPILVSPGQGKEAPRGLTASALAYGRKPQTAFALYDPTSHGLKTAQCSLFAGLIESSVTLPRWGTMQNGVLWELPPSGLAMYEKECGYWPTPTRRDFRGQNDYQKTIQRIERGERGFMSQIGNYLMVCLGGNHGKLNPRFLEDMMLWPIGWTGLEPLGMDRFQMWLEQHGNF